MYSPTSRGGGGSGGCRSPLVFLIFILSILLTTVDAQAEVGYGPKFDACGDNCQTQLLHFCTQLRDAQQQKDCWCGLGDLDAQYVAKMDACLATCDPNVSNTAVQRDMILRYRAVVCRGDASKDAEFSAYYSARYGGQFVPQPTKAAPPPAPPQFTTTLRGTPITFIILTPTTPTSKELQKSKSPHTENKPAIPPTPKPSEKVSAEPSTTKHSMPKSKHTPKPTSTLSRSPSPLSSVSPTSESSSLAPTHTGPHHTSNLESSTNPPPSNSQRTLSAGEITGISLASLAGFISILIAAACLYRVRNRKRDSKMNYIWSPITPIDKQARTTPDSLGKNTASIGGFRSSLARWLRWRPEPPELDIHPQYIDGGEGVPTIRIQSPSAGARRVNVSPPMMMSNSVGMDPVTHGAHLNEQAGLEVVVPENQPPHSGGAYAIPYPAHYPQPHPRDAPQGASHDDIVSPLERREVILPPTPHAVTTPSGYYNVPPSRPFSEATGFTDYTTDTEMTQSEWTDYGDQTDSANKRRLDQLLQEVDLGYRGAYAEMYGDPAEGRPGTSGTQATTGTRRSVQQRQLQGGSEHCF